MSPTSRSFVALLAVVLAGCGGGGGGATTTATGPGKQAHHRPGGGVPAPAAGLLPAGAAGSFQRVVSSSGGQLGLAVAPLGEGPVQTVGNLPSGKAWSTIKVPILVTLLREVGGEGALSGTERADAAAALTESSNDAAMALFSVLEGRDGGLAGASRAVQDELRRAADSRTLVNTKPAPDDFSTYGQTDWSASAATLFYRALGRGCLLPSPDTGYVLGLMRKVVPDQRWGLGAAGFPGGTALAFKGGWGPQPDGTYLVRQSGIVGAGRSAYAVTIIALPRSGTADSFAAGQSMVTDAARWLRQQVGEGRPFRSAPCSS